MTGADITGADVMGAEVTGADVTTSDMIAGVAVGTFGNGVICCDVTLLLLVVIAERLVRRARFRAGSRTSLDSRLRADTDVPAAAALFVLLSRSASGMSDSLDDDLELELGLSLRVTERTIRHIVARTQPRSTRERNSDNNARTYHYD